MSIIGTFSIMYLLGYSIDNLSLMALTLSVGFVVDDAIVMLENIVRHMEMGKRPLQEVARDGAGEIGFTILSMTLSLAAAAAEEVPQALVAQLADGGKMVLPLGPLDGTQHIVKLTKTAGGLSRQNLIAVRFVPLLPGQAREL